MNQIKNVKHTVYFSTNSNQGCTLCAGLKHGCDIDSWVNHYIDQHGYSLLHVGSEWGMDSSGASISHTVAMLGLLP